MSDHACGTVHDLAGDDVPADASDFKHESGVRLLALREGARRKREEAAEVLGCSVDKIGSIERGRTSISRMELRALLDFYGVDTEQAEEIEALAEKARKRRSPSPWSAAVPPRLKRFFRLEETALRIRTYNPELIHGLAQTEDYARALISGEGVLRPAVVDQLVRARMARQARLSGPNPVELTVALPEAGIRSGVGGPDLMREQIRHLIALSESGRATIRVIPYGAQYRGRSFPFTILTPARRLTTLVYLENMLDGVVVEDAARVSEYEEAFDNILGDVALSSRDTVRVLATVASEL